MLTTEQCVLYLSWLAVMTAPFVWLWFHAVRSVPWFPPGCARSLACNCC